MAAALQEQYRLEFLQRQAIKHQATRPPPVQPSAPPQPSMQATFQNDNEAAEARRARDLQEMEDERLARRLAEEESQNYVRRASSVRPSSTAYSATTNATSAMPSAGPRNTTNQAPPYASAEPTIDLFSTNATEVEAEIVLDQADDARLAQQLQDEELARRMSYSTPQEQAPPKRQFSQFQDERLTSTPVESPFVFEEDEDMRRARRAAQELQDEEMARRMTCYEQEALSRQQAQVAQQQIARRSYQRTCWTRVLPILLCAIAIALPCLFLFGVFSPSQVPGLSSLGANGGVFGPNANAVDPFSNVTLNPKTASHWPESGHGLTLQILNALDDPWYSYFYKAVQEWNDGTPDALTLSTVTVTPDSTCSPVTGKLKVCNGNYGNTQWLGINEILVDRRTNTIYASSAKMNEYYLQSASTDQKQYTMCHEMGHGFGLPHWDENFYNADLGNCMDYTIHPSVNMQPSRSNYDFLAEMYGTVDGSTVPPGVTFPGTYQPCCDYTIPGGSSATTSASTSGGTMAPTTSYNAASNNGGRQRYLLSSRNQRRDGPEDWVWLEYARVIKEFYDVTLPQRILVNRPSDIIESNIVDDMNSNHHHHTLELGDDYVIHVHILFVQW